jgi:hypothetical protein
MLNRRDKVTDHEIQIVRRVVFDSIPWRRMLVLTTFAERACGSWFSLEKLVDVTATPKSTLNLLLADLTLLGVIEQKVVSKDKTRAKRYRLQEEYWQVIRTREELHHQPKGDRPAREAARDGRRVASTATTTRRPSRKRSSGGRKN